MNYTVLSHVINELSVVLLGAKTDKIIPLEKGGLCFRFRTRNMQYQLLLSPDRALPRIHLLSGLPKAADHPGAFYLQIRKHAGGSRLSGIALLGSDRIVELRFDRRGSIFTIIFELIGGGANLVLTDHRRQIAAVLHPTAPGLSPARILLPGMVYEAPVLRGKPPGVGAPTGLQISEVDYSSGIGINRAVERGYEKLLREQQETSERHRLRKILERELSKIERRLLAVSRDLEVSERSGTFRKCGELILANLNSIHRGQDRFTVVDFDGFSQSISLDPLLTAPENADRYFKKYKKAKAGIAMLRERLESSKSEEKGLRDLWKELSECPPARMLQIGEVLRERGLDLAVSGQRSPSRPAVSSPYKTIIFAGWDILVGKSAAGNDYITMILAKPDDLWLHAEGMPGSHVLVRNPGKREIPDDVIRKAAAFAAFHSKGKGSARVPVAYTDAKYVRKPKGARAGMVVLAQRRTIMAAPEAS